MLVEAALITPVIVALIAGMFEVTRAVARYQIVELGVRAGARYLARVPAVSTSSAVETWGLERARCLATRGVAAPAATCDSAGACRLTDWCDAASRASITVNVDDLFASPPRIRLETIVTFGAPLFSFFGRSSALSMRVVHEEPFIGE